MPPQQAAQFVLPCENRAANHLWLIGTVEMLMDEHVFIHDYAIQVFPVWAAVAILIALAFGLWKLAKIVWAAISN